MFTVERRLPVRIFCMVALGFALSFLIIGSGSALKLSIGTRAITNLPATNAQSYRLLELVNQERQTEGLKPLKLNDSLQQSALAKCSDMVSRNYWGHITPEGKNAALFIRNAGIDSFSKAGENLAIGQHSLAEANQDWIHSPEHRANIMDKKFTDVGFAECTYNSGQAGLSPLQIYVEHFVAL